MKAKTTISIDTLPKGIKASDLKNDYKNHLPYDQRPAHLPYCLTFYLVKSAKSYRNDQWVMTTLSINNKGRAYGIGLDDKGIYSVGVGPHVVKTVNVYFSTKNIKRLQPFIDLYMQGATTANMIRDRRSTRIARTKARKAELASWLS